MKVWVLLDSLEESGLGCPVGVTDNPEIAALWHEDGEFSTRRADDFEINIFAVDMRTKFGKEAQKLLNK